MDIERAAAVRKLQQDMLAHIYAHQKKIIAEKMYMYCLENQNRLNTCTNTFIHNGKWYSAGDKVNKYANRKLHPDLKHEIIMLFHTEYESLLQQGTIQVHFGKVLMLANCINDLLELVPYPFYKLINKLDPSIFNIGPPLTQDQIAEFKEENKDSITILSTVLMLELLLAK